MHAAALPVPLRAAWEEIATGEQRIVAAMQAQDFAALVPLATARHASILRFFELYPAETANAPLRYDLLQELIERNKSLLDDSRARLGAAADASTQATHARRAVGAYHASS
jgi:hypothetical protein